MEQKYLIHHVWAHTEQHTVEVARLGGIAESLGPGWLAVLILSIDGLEDLVELAFDFGVIF